MTRISDFAAIDPLALLLPTPVYVVVTEKLHPHVPKVMEVREALKDVSGQERAFILNKARALAACAKVVEEALS